MSAPTYEPQPQRSGMATALAAGAIVVLLCANIYLYVQIDHLRGDLTDAQATLKAQGAELGSLRETSSVSAAAQSQHVDALKAELAEEQKSARTMSSQAKAEALAHADQLNKQIEAAQAKMQAETAAEIGSVKQAADTANNKIADVSTDVGTVKTNLASTNADLQKTIADLKSAKGDLGVQSGLIATNGTELALEVMADDKVTEKKDRSINEPVQFYTGRATQPYELVVNQVQKNVIVGYLSTPKVQTSR